MDKLILNAKPLLGFDKDYRVTENGDIISMDYRRIGKPKKLAPQRNVHGYAIIKLMKGGKDITYRVHRLVAMAFVPNPEKLPCINHKDENKLNNNPNNLDGAITAIITIMGHAINVSQNQLPKFGN